MAEEIGLILLWTAVSLAGLWALLRFLPLLIRFFWGEFKQGKDSVTDLDTETMVIKVKKDREKRS